LQLDINGISSLLVQWGKNGQNVNHWGKANCTFPMAFTEIYTITSSADTSDADFTGTGTAQTRITTRGLVNSISNNGFAVQSAVNTLYIAIGV
jgi:hypothetical protein